MDLRKNINRIHADLLMAEGIGENVSIAEASNKEIGNHFVLSAVNSGMTARMIIEKTEIEKYTFRWRYFANPNDESAGLVERTSTVDSFSADVMDVFNKKRFDSDYLSQILD